MAEKLANTVPPQVKSIPIDVIEAILSRLPVKSLLRFQSLSKSCKATISDPSFAKISHNHSSKKTQNLFLISEKDGEPFHLLRLEGSSILHTEAELAAPFGAAAAVPLCSCNGLVLLGPGPKNPRNELILWNPSIRKHATIHTPIILLMRFLKIGLHHDSRTDDYKVVIISYRHHLEFSCKIRAWVKKEVIPGGDRDILFEGAVVDGCFYWPDEREREILCYDLRERRMTESLKPPDERRIGPGQLRRICGRLWSIESEILVIYCDCEKRYKELERWYDLVPYSESMFFPLETETSYKSIYISTSSAMLEAS